jgi:hypothetical protein
MSDRQALAFWVVLFCLFAVFGGILHAELKCMEYCAAQRLWYSRIREMRCECLLYEPVEETNIP